MQQKISMTGATEHKEKYIARVRIARLHSGLQQQDIADCLGVDRSTYANWESRREMPQRYITKFCKATGVTEKWLLRGEDDMVIIPQDLTQAIEYITQLKKIDEDGFQYVRNLAKKMLDAARHKSL